MQHTCIIRSSHGDVIAAAICDSRNGLYKLRGDTFFHCSEVSSNPMSFALSCSSDRLTTVEVWHRRLGHYHPQGPKRMICSSTVRALPKLVVTNTPCSTCLGGKQTRSSIPKQWTTYSKFFLELVHIDIAGPFRIPSLGGNYYFLTFTDDYSRKTWIYFLCSKDDCFTKFQFFHQMVENLSRH